MTTAAGSDSPVAAISYKDLGTGEMIRQLFFTNSAHYLFQTNLTGSDTTWSTPSAVTSEPLADGSPALAACTTVQNTNGSVEFYKRVYYGDSDNYIQEIGWNPDNADSNPGWTKWYQFPQSDGKTGVGCATYVNSTESASYLNLFMRNATNNNVQQWWWNYGVNDEWHSGEQARADSLDAAGPPLRKHSLTSSVLGLTTTTVINIGSDIAITPTDYDMNYVFFQYGSGEIRRDAVYSGEKGVENGWINVTQPDTGVLGTHLAAAYVDQGPMLFFQQDSESITVKDYLAGSAIMTVNETLS